jgi:hypothetical protein
MPKPIRDAESAEIGCRIGAKSGAAFRRNHLPLSTEIRCRFAPIFAPKQKQRRRSRSSAAEAEAAPPKDVIMREFGRQGAGV